MYEEMLASIKKQTTKAVLTVSVKKPEAFERKEVANVREGRVAASAKKATSAPVRRTATPGPNDPCPCGSGKKYKKCCALKENN
jgi:preprotein translocase subunit SecA